MPHQLSEFIRSSNAVVFGSFRFTKQTMESECWLSSMAAAFSLGLFHTNVLDRNVMAKLFQINEDSSPKTKRQKTSIEIESANEMESDRETESKIN